MVNDMQGAREAFLDKVPIPTSQQYVIKEGLPVKVSHPLSIFGSFSTSKQSSFRTLKRFAFRLLKSMLPFLLWTFSDRFGLLFNAMPLFTRTQFALLVRL